MRWYRRMISIIMIIALRTCTHSVTNLQDDGNYHVIKLPQASPQALEFARILIRASFHSL